MPDLKPCPFCGGKAKLYVRDVGVSVMCRECFAQTDICLDRLDYQGDEGAVDFVIEAWNRRASDD